MKFKDTYYKDLTGTVYDGEIDLRQLSVTSLEGAPLEIRGNFICSETEITSLKYAPATIRGNLYAGRSNLKTLQDMPTDITGSIYLNGNNIASLKGAPYIANGLFDCSDNKLTSLEGAPKLVQGSFICSFNKITTFKGAENMRVTGDFDCRKNPIENIKEEIVKYNIVANRYITKDGTILFIEVEQEMKKYNSISSKGFRTLLGLTK